MKMKFNIIADKPNKNGDVYSKDAMKKAIEKYNEKVVKPKLALGIAGQPQGKSAIGIAGLAGQPQGKSMNLMDVAFQIESIKEIDDSWEADIKFVPTQSGKVLEELIKNPDDFRIVTSCVGTVSGSTHHRNGEEVTIKHVNDMEIISVGIEPKENCA